jgi:hypothetical protein
MIPGIPSRGILLGTDFFAGDHALPMIAPALIFDSNPANSYVVHLFSFPPSSAVRPDSTSTWKPGVEKNASFLPLEVE